MPCAASVKELRASPNDGEEERFDGDRERSRVGRGGGCSRTEEFSVVVADAEEAPDLTLRGSMRDELSEHGTGQVTDQAVGMHLPLGAAFEGPGGKPLN